MDKNELLGMLDLGGSDKPSGADPIATETTAPTAAPSDTAIQLDDWGIRRGKDLLAENPAIRKHLGDEAQLAAADLFGLAFEPDPQPVEACTDQTRLDFVRTLMETPEYHSLHTDTMLHDIASEIAATHFSEQLGRLYVEERKCKTPAERDLACMKCASSALSKATAEVAEAKDAESALGMGPGGHGSNDPKAIAALYRRVRNSATLRRICELAGRFRRFAQGKQRQKAAHGMDDVVGVEMDADLGRLLPHELAKLAIEDFEDDTLRRLVERQTMCREHRTLEPVAKGPIVVVVDESGSMQNDKGHTAKAIALALAWVARQQRRWVALVAFSGGAEGRTLALPPGRWNEVALMDWLEAFLGGGTTLDVPLVELPNTYWPRFVKDGLTRGKTDVLIITDAIVQAPAEIVASFNAWRAAEQARVISLIIQGEPGDLAKVSDETHKVQTLDTSETGVEAALSI